MLRQGLIDHQAVRYVLHRMFVQKYGYIAAFEVVGDKFFKDPGFNRMLEGFCQSVQPFLMLQTAVMLVQCFVDFLRCFASWGWYIKGLEPSGDHWHEHVPEKPEMAKLKETVICLQRHVGYLHSRGFQLGCQEWVPTYLQDLLEKRLHHKACLAAHYSSLPFK